MSVECTLSSRPCIGHRRHRRQRRHSGLRRLPIAGGAAAYGGLVALAAGAAVLLCARRWTRRVVVEGGSMLPAFEPGDRLLAVRLPRVLPVRQGVVVVLPDPRTPGRLLVKRVADVSESGVTVAGDNGEASTDSRAFGTVEEAQIWGRVLYRYSPPARAGRVRRSLSGASDSPRLVPLR